MIEVLLASALIGVLAMALTLVVGQSFEGQRSVRQRQSAALLQLRVVSLLADRDICSLNFRNARTDAGTDVNNLLSATGVQAFIKDNLYEDQTIRLTGMRLLNFRPYANAGKDQFRGTMELALTLTPEGKGLGATEMVRNIPLLVQLNGYTPVTGVATRIETCTTAGSEVKNIWTLKSNGDIYYKDFNVGIGTDTPSQKLEIAGSVLARAYLHSSDERLKHDITSAPGLTALEKLRGVHFVWRESGRAALGLIAQNVEEVFPEAVATDERTTMKSVSYDQMIAPLIESVKELSRDNREMARQIEELERRREVR